MRFFLNTCVSLSLLAIALAYFGVENTLRNAQNIKIEYFILALALAILQIPLSTRRWQLVLNLLTPIPTFLNCLRAQTLSMYAGLFVPGIISGTAIKTVLMRRLGVRIKYSLLSLIFDKIAIAMPLLCAISFALPFMADEYFLDKEFGNVPKIVLATFFVICGFLISAILFFKYLKKDSQVLKDLFYNHKQKFIFIFLWGFMLICTGIAQYWVLFEFSVSIEKLVLVAPAVIFISSLPLSIGGWGLREGSGILLFTLIGVPGEVALLASIQVGLSGAISSLFGAFLWSKDFIPEAKEVMKVAINRHTEKN